MHWLTLMTVVYVELERSREATSRSRSKIAFSTDGGSVRCCLHRFQRASKNCRPSVVPPSTLPMAALTVLSISLASREGVCRRAVSVGIDADEASPVAGISQPGLPGRRRLAKACLSSVALAYLPTHLPTYVRAYSHEWTRRIRVAW